jgi:hypothetical protein
MNNSKQVFTAYLVRNFRDVSYDPKVLLIDIEYEDGTKFRDHMWTKKNKVISNFIPAKNNFKTKIKFKGKIKEYISSDGPKKGIVNISNIKIID